MSPSSSSRHSSTVTVRSNDASLTLAAAVTDSGDFRGVQVEAGRSESNLKFLQTVSQSMVIIIAVIVLPAYLGLGLGLLGWTSHALRELEASTFTLTSLFNSKEVIHDVRRLIS